MSTPPEPRARRSIRSEDRESKNTNNYFHDLHVKPEERSFERQESLNSLQDEESSNYDSSDYDEQIKIPKATKKTRNDKIQALGAQSHSSTASPNREKSPPMREDTGNYRKIESSSSSWLSKSLFVIVLFIVLYMLRSSLSTSEHVQHTTDNLHLLLCDSMEELRAKFHNQESYIWSDIESGINELISRARKVPCIILLYANETDTMDCLATEIARVGSAVLHTEGPFTLGPKEFGDDPGKITYKLKFDGRLVSRKVVIIRDILNIDANAIKALHNLCDRYNPLFGEVIYILTMRTIAYDESSHKPSQKPLARVEEQLYRRLSESIDSDVWPALVTRITDGAIIPVHPEPHLRYCT